MMTGRKIWKFDDNNEVIPALKLSYYDLPADLKRVFKYCCLLPKDYMFDKDELVLLWMAEGYLCNLDEVKPMEILGGEYFTELVSRSFFQRSANDISRYTMHDLVRDLATSVAGEFFLKVDGKIDSYQRNGVVEKVHHVSFIQKRYEPYNKFKELLNARHLRTFLPMEATGLPQFKNLNVPKKAILELFPQLKFLRVLSLAGYNITEVPESIGRFKHLRYLNISNTPIACLPEQVCDLQNLQSLLLYECYYLSSLPDSISKLINLRHLDLTRTPLLKKMPLGISELKGLHTLTKVVIGENDEYNISLLKDLMHLQGHFSINDLHKVKNALQAKEGKLVEKKGVRDLHLQWSEVFDGSRNEATEYEVLEGLRPFQKLTSLTIDYYGGIKFPGWVGDPSFVCLTKVRLSGCERCSHFPTLGYLPLLEDLLVEGMHGLERLDSEFLAPSLSYNGVAFPSLKKLSFWRMLGWKEWLCDGDDKAKAFPSLGKVELVNCPKLDVVRIKPIPSLQDIHISECSLVVLRSMVGVSSSIDFLHIDRIKGLAQLYGETLWPLRAIHSLSIMSCDELTHLWESEEFLRSLWALDVYLCPNLVSLGKEKATSMESLVHVRISNCKTLESYNCPSNVETLVIRYCPSLASVTFSTTDGLSSSLMQLTIDCCDVVDPCCLKDNFLVSLESLKIESMLNLRLLDKGYLNHLTSLTIDDCDNIVSIPEEGYGFLPFRCLEFLKLIRCKNLNSFPHAILPMMESLKEMQIVDCPCLDYSVNWVGWPPNLEDLTVGGGLKNPISEWRLQNLPTTLSKLTLYGDNLGVVSFAKIGFLLPPSLKSLEICGFKKLKSVSEGLQHLTCLEDLCIRSSPELKDLPERLLLSLSSLRLVDTPKLKKKCGEKKGIFSQIPYLHVWP